VDLKYVSDASMLIGHLARCTALPGASSRLRRRNPVVDMVDIASIMLKSYPEIVMSSSSAKIADRGQRLRSTNAYSRIIATTVAIEEALNNASVDTRSKFIENLDAMIKVVDNYRRRLLSAFEQSRGVEQRISLSARAPQQRKRDTEMLFLVSALALPRDIKTLDKLDESVKVLLTEIKEGKFTRAAALFATPASDELMQAASAEARTVREALVSNKKVVSSGEMTTALSITRQALSKAVKANRFFVLTVGGEDYYPGFFADPDLDRRQLESVSKALGDLPGWEKWRFFTTPKSSLIRLTPLEALKKGMYRQVLTAATGFAER